MKRKANWWIIPGFFALAVDGIKNSGQDYYPSYMFKLQNGFLFNGQKNSMSPLFGFFTHKEEEEDNKKKDWKWLKLISRIS